MAIGYVSKGIYGSLTFKIYSVLLKEIFFYMFCVFWDPFEGAMSSSNSP